MSNELLQTIARVKRAMPRNGDVMSVCSALEEVLTVAPENRKRGPKTRAEIQREYRIRKKAKSNG